MFSTYSLSLFCMGLFFHAFSMQKKKHHQLRQVPCKRCRLLREGHIITAVGGHGGYSGSNAFVTAEELRDRLSHLRKKKVLIVKLVDIVDFNGSFLNRVRDIVGANPIIFVVTKVIRHVRVIKVDLLPKDTDLSCVGDWVIEALRKKKLNVISVHLTSSKFSIGISGVVSEIHRQMKGRDVYIVGMANVGKSAFISAMLKNMGTRNIAAAAALKCQPLQSAVPGTTLGSIPIKAFSDGQKLYDTPGIHLHNRQTAVLSSHDLPLLMPKKRIVAKTTPPASNGSSVFWGGLVRVDVLNPSPDIRLTFYGPSALDIHTVPTPQADHFYQRELGFLLTPPTSRDETWKGLGDPHPVRVNFTAADRPACNVGVSGLGWISVEPVSARDDVTRGLLELAVHVHRPVEVYVYPPMPVGQSPWYRSSPLTYKEKHFTPKLFLQK